MFVQHCCFSRVEGGRGLDFTQRLRKGKGRQLRGRQKASDKVQGRAGRTHHQGEPDPVPRRCSSGISEPQESHQFGHPDGGQQGR